MTDSITLTIPDDVKDNISHTVRVVSNGVRDEEGGVPAAEQLIYYRCRHESLGYDMTETDHIDENDNRVVTTTFRSYALDKIVWTFRTEFYTRIPCARHCGQWAQVYVSFEQETWKTEPEPLCGDHWSREETRVSRMQQDVGIDVKLHRSDWLRIGQF